MKLSNKLSGPILGILASACVQSGVAAPRYPVTPDTCNDRAEMHSIIDGTPDMHMELHEDPSDRNLITNTLDCVVRRDSLDCENVNILCSTPGITCTHRTPRSADIEMCFDSTIHGAVLTTTDGCGPLLTEMDLCDYEGARGLPWLHCRDQGRTICISRDR